MTEINYYNLPFSNSDLHDKLLDFSLFADHHPYMKKVDRLNPSTFQIHEEVPAMFLKLKAKYTAEISEDHLSELIIYKAKVPLMNLQIKFKITKGINEKSSNLCEHIIVTGPPVLRSAFAGLVKRAHLKFLTPMEKKSSLQQRG